MYKNAKITLIKYTTDDFDLYYELVKSKEVMAMITQHALKLEEAQRSFQRKINLNQHHENFGCFKVYENKTNQYIGFAKLDLETPYAQEAELGYMLFPQFWGNGFGSEIANVLIQAVKSEKQIKVIKAIIHPENTASKKILLKNGFISDGHEVVYGLKGEKLTLKN